MATIRLISRAPVQGLLVTSALLLAAAPAFAQTPCYAWGGILTNTNGTLYPTPAAACSSNNIVGTCTVAATCTNVYTVGKATGSFADNNATFSCDEHTTAVGSPSDCASTPGLCGVFFFPDARSTSEHLISPTSTCADFWTQVAIAMAKPQPKNSVSDPVDPATGNVFKSVQDLAFSGGADAIAFQRFYNSADTIGSDLGPGWRHSYDQSISVTYQSNPATYPGASVFVSKQYLTPSAACTNGFADVDAAVPAWGGATATYTNNVCVVSGSSGTLATLPIFSAFGSPPSTSVVEYDVTREDGQLIRFTTQNDGAISAPPGISLRLALTASGYTLSDDQDNVESYSAAGVLQSITARSGVVKTMSYDTNGLLSTVTDSFGNVLTFNRNVGFGLASITASGAGSVQYTYDADLRLISVTNLDGTTRGYTYGNASLPNALTAETDENGTTLTSWSYNSVGQALSSQQAAGANAASLTYNGNGSTSVTDALGAVRMFGFTRVGDITQIASISGSQCPTCDESAATNYDAAGFVASRTDYNGNVTCYANDPVRGLELFRLEGVAPGGSCPTQLSSYTPASGSTQRLIATTYSTSFRLPTQIAEPTRTSTFSYDSDGNLLTKTIADTTVTPSASRTWTYTYDSFGHVLTAKGPRSDVNSTTTYQYYNCSSGSACGQLQTITDAVGNVTTFSSYNAYGQPLTITDPNGVVTTLTYDARQRLTSRSAAGETTSFSYLHTGLLQTVTLPDSSTLSYTYDAAHRLTQIQDGAGNSIQYTLDALGNRTAISAVDASGTLSRTQSRVYNTLSELSQLVGSAGTSAVTTTYGFDAQGNQTSINAPLSRNTANAFDALNRLMQITDPHNGVTQLAYDANDNLVSVKDPANLSTSYQYDGFGDLLQLVSPATGTTVNTYDLASNLSTTQDARGVGSTYSYDADNRLTQVAYGDQTIIYGYDTGTNGKGRLSSASDANHSMNWGYDALGRVNNKSQSVAGVTLTTAYAYTNGDLTTLTTPSGQSIVYSYANHQISSIAVNGTTLLSGIGYESFGPTLGWTWGNGTSEVRLHDTDGNPSQISGAEATSYSLDSAFRIVGISNAANSALSWTYGYDSLDRLSGANNASTALIWTYDADGNRLSQSSGTAPPASVSTLTYNNRGRMISATTNLGAISALYNALGQRIEKTTSTAAKLFYYDEAGHLIGEYDNGGNLIEETVWMGDLPVATLRPNGSGGINAYYIHADHLGAPKSITRPTDNAIVWRWDQDPFGTATPNQNPAGLGTFVYNLRFPGQYYDQETGLNYNYFRDYDPSVGRYIESDPVGLQAGVNTYAYVGDDPIGYFDPFGLDETHVVNKTGGRSAWDGPTNGNWGGKCWSGGQYSCGGHPMGTKPPTDSADRCYMHHDNCYDKCSAIKDGKAQKACLKACDDALVKELKALPDDPTKWPEPPPKGTEGDTKTYLKGAIRIF